MSKSFPACPADRSAWCWACRIWKSITFHSEGLVDRSMTVPFPFCCFLIFPSFGWKTSMGVPENMLWPSQIATQGQWNEMALVHFLADKPLSKSWSIFNAKASVTIPSKHSMVDYFVWGTAWSRRDSSSCSSSFFSWEFLLSISSSSWSWIGINKNPLKSSGLSPLSPLVW